MILITKSKCEYIIDDEDFEKVQKFCWRATTPNRKKRYIRTTIRAEGKQFDLLLHRYLLNLTEDDGTEVDHINGNSLDNRKSNLRIVSPQQNQANRGKQLNNSTGYKGVSKASKGLKNPWEAKIRFNGKSIYLGTYPSKEDAAKAYNEAAIKYFGECAVLNII